MLADKPLSALDRFLFLPFGVLALWFAIRGVSTGEIPMNIATVRRSDNEIFFWLGIVVHFIVGILLLLAFIFGTSFWK